MGDIFDKVAKEDIFDRVDTGVKTDIFDKVALTYEERVQKYGGISAEPEQSGVSKVGEFIWRDILPTQFLSKSGRELARHGITASGEPVGEANVRMGEAAKALDLGIGGGTVFGIGKKVITKSAKETAERIVKETAKPSRAQQILKGADVEDDLPKYAGSINLEKQAIPDELKHLEVEAAKIVPKKTQSLSETARLSDELRKNPVAFNEVIKKIADGGAPNAIEARAIREANAEGVTAVQQMAGLPPDEFDKVFNAYVDGIFKTTTKASSESGRALNSYKEVIAPEKLARAFTKLERSLNERELLELKNLDTNDPVAVKVFIDRLGDPKLKDYVYEYWYNAILSGPPTHVVNIMSNTAWQAFQIPHRALTAGVDKVFSSFTGKKRTRYLNEIVPMMAGYKTGFIRGAVSAKDMFRTGKIAEYETKWAKEVGSALGSFERSPNKAVRKLAPYLTVPTKALRAMDVWANSMAYDAQINAIAKRTANLKGLKGAEAKTFQRTFAENIPENAHKEAMEFAKYSTFMDDPGEFSKWILSGRDKIPFGRLIVPFVTTIGNLMKRGLEMTPGVGLKFAKGQNPAEVAAKQIEGALLSLYIMYKVDKGEITGAAPTDANKRRAFYRQGKKAWSMKVGDSNYQYRRIEPFNTVIASATIAHEAMSDINAGEKDVSEAVFDAGNSFKNNLIDSSYLQGISQIFNRHGSAKGTTQRMAASFIPYSGMFRSLARAYEAQTEGSAKIREKDSWIAAFGTTIPGLSKTIPAELNVWGKKIEIEGGVFRQWLPYKWSKQTTDPVETAFEKLDVYPGHPSQNFTIAGEVRKFDNDIYKDLLIYYGSTAKEIMDDIVSREEIQELINNPDSHNTVKKIIDRKLTRSRTAARKMAISKQLERTGEY